jgi:hypothetical protein
LLVSGEFEGRGGMSGMGTLHAVIADLALANELGRIHAPVPDISSPLETAASLW